MSPRSCAVVVLCLALIPLAGCGKKFPAIVPTEGTVMLNGKPLANASVTFVPLLEQFGAESSSTGVTDEQGHFTLTCRYNNQPGAAVGEHVVVIAEVPMPQEMRKVQDSRAIDAFRAKSGNRPIPADYTSFGKSPLRVTVKQGQESVPIVLNR
jgi:hypothetical protein